MAQFGPGAVDLSTLKSEAEKPRDGEFSPFVTLTDTTIEDDAIRFSQKVPVIVQVGSARSAESEQLKAAFSRIVVGRRDVRVGYVDADATPMLAQMLGVRQVPTVLALAAGCPVASFEGGQPETELTQWVAGLVASVGPQLEGLPEVDAAGGGKEDPRLDAATQALNQGDFDAALAVYDEMLRENPGNARVRQAKATVTVLARSQGEGEQEGVDKELARADVEALSGEPEKAFDRLLALVKEEPRAKERLLELFGMFEANDPRVIAARTKLASALF
ncbi:hypothetical protein CAPI_06440 [Corynebacterium capitovis DSM 44611]|uniref:tetratricopeptide repeat protein n=1 Tax=Corynebacterium capitovis TaxID=131081 RepID=UPI0003749031|nr:tetratricopeptide repeat protein [Corynebacterium capitovis]WKD57829.1 hypothetical protein CAPI_06440 [Corynebacterium capitovis DSM 44611]